MEQIKKSTCYVCMIDDLELVKTCGQSIHEICQPCKLQIVESNNRICPMCRNPLLDVPAYVPEPEDYYGFNDIDSEGEYVYVPPPTQEFVLRMERLNHLRFEIGARLTRSIAQNTDAQEFAEQLIENYRQMFGVDRKRRHFETLDQYRQFYNIKTDIHCIINSKDANPDYVADLEDAQDLYRYFKKIFKDYNLSFTVQSILDVLLANMHLI